MFILIIVFVAGYSVQSSGNATTREFATEAACQRAARNTEETTFALSKSIGSNYTRVSAFCVPH